MGILSAKKIKGKILFLGLIIVLSCGYIILTVNNIIWRKNIESITNYTYLSGAAIEEICQRDISLLTELSEKIDVSGTAQDTENLKLLSEFASNHAFEYVAVVNPEGNGITNLGQPVSLSETGQLKEVLGGRAGISCTVQISGGQDEVLAIWF